MTLRAKVGAGLSSNFVRAHTSGDLEQLVSKAKLRGPAVHDGRIAALCRLHGVRELWSADRDFCRMDLKVENPLLG